MTNLSASKQRPVKIPPGGLNTRVVRLAGYTNFGGGSTAFTVYKGAVVMSDVSDTDGYARDMDSGVTATTSDIFLGIAAEKVSVTSADTSDGDKKLTVYVDGLWGFAKGSIAITDLGADAFASDDDTVTTTATGNLEIGVIVDVDDTYVWVDISNHAGLPSAGTT